MQNIDYLSEVIRLEYLQSLQSNRGKSSENLQREEDIMITFSDLNVWFLNKDSDIIDEVKEIFDSLSQNKLGKANLRDFMRVYSQQLMDSVQSIQDQQIKIQSMQSVITNAQYISQLFAQYDYSSNESLSTCSDSTMDSKISKDMAYIPNKNIELTSAKSYRNSQNKIKLSIHLKEIINIDLNPSFSNHNLEGYQIEIGEEKNPRQSTTRSLEGVSINWKDEKINLTIRPKNSTIFIKLYEVLASGYNLVAQIVIDPFSLLFPHCFSKDCHQFSNNIINPSVDELIHNIPLQSVINPSLVYCNLVISSSFSPYTKSVDDQSTARYFSQNEWISTILQARTHKMSKKIQNAVSKSQKIIQHIQIFMKPFQSIKIDESYLKLCQI